jgi:hypothetical protein
MQATQVLELAEKHADNNASARLCFDEAQRWNADGFTGHAKRAALRSLKHSVGVFHFDYKIATA